MQLIRVKYTCFCDKLPELADFAKLKLCIHLTIASYSPLPHSSGLSGWTQCNHKRPYKRESEEAMCQSDAKN
jgi:hypothetical protein